VRFGADGGVEIELAVSSENFNMSAKNGIKIVKRSVQIEAQAQPKKVESHPRPAQTVAHHVASWVKEFHERRREERFRSFDSLFQRA
jgi:hypothetical protein